MKHFFLLLVLILTFIACQRDKTIENTCANLKPADTLWLTFEKIDNQNIYKESPNQIVVFKQLSNFDSLTWSGIVRKDNLIAIEDGQYQLQYFDKESDNASSNYRQVIISIESCQECISFPKYISPNNDGVNDCFIATTSLCSYELSVENDWGESIDTRIPNWEKYLPAAKYHYLCEASFPNGNQITQAGDFVVLD